VTGSRDATLRVWDVQRGLCLWVLEGHSQSVRCIDVCGRRVVSGSYDNTCRVGPAKFKLKVILLIFFPIDLGCRHRRVFACPRRSFPPDLLGRVRWGLRRVGWARHHCPNLGRLDWGMHRASPRPHCSCMSTPNLFFLPHSCHGRIGRTGDHIFPRNLRTTASNRGS